MTMTRTRFLVAIAVAAMAIELFPGYAGIVKWAAIALAITYLVVRALSTYPRQLREKRRRAAQAAADAAEYQRYEHELEQIRATHDPTGRWVGVETIPDEYQGALTKLHARHRAMLERKFGPH